MKLGVHGNDRGKGIVEFGADVTAEFCRRNGIDLVVRSHQYVREGFKVTAGANRCNLLRTSDRDAVIFDLRFIVGRSCTGGD